MKEQEISELKKQLEDVMTKMNKQESRIETLTSLVMMLLNEQEDTSNE